jgi:hypothetical protein
VPVPNQESERSCICVLGGIYNQESERSCICVLGGIYNQESTNDIQIQNILDVTRAIGDTLTK